MFHRILLANCVTVSKIVNMTLEAGKWDVSEKNVFVLKPISPTYI